MFKVTPDMIKINSVEFCRKCKKEFKISIVNVI